MKSYEKPELELIRFQTEDIVTGSPGVDEGEHNSDGTYGEP